MTRTEIRDMLVTAFPGWDVHEDSADVDAFSGPWRVRVTLNGAVSLYFKPKDRGPLLLLLWTRPGALPELIAAAQAEIRAAGTAPLPAPEPEKPEPHDLAGKARRVVEALRAKPRLLNHVLYVLGVDKVAGPWGPQSDEDDDALLGNSRIRYDSQGQRLGFVLTRQGSNGFNWWCRQAVQYHSPSQGTADSVEDGQKIVDDFLRDQGWRLL